MRKQAFLDLLEDLGSHSLYYPGPLCEQLEECGLSAHVAPDDKGLVLENTLIPSSEPEWGEPGISPMSLLATVCKLEIGEVPDASFLTGRGFRFRHVMDKLAEYWGLEARYL